MTEEDQGKVVAVASRLARDEVKIDTADLEALQAQLHASTEAIMVQAAQAAEGLGLIAAALEDAAARIRQAGDLLSTAVARYSAAGEERRE